MLRDRSKLTREKRLLPPLPEDYRRGAVSHATLTDDHSLLLLHLERERRAKLDPGRSWLSRLLLRR
ncbi:MAG TPA: hypothetical protein PLA50_01390 [Bacteroidia bacterium]|nr:hypothetical protein [Bacteroidia bacterium]